MKLIKLSDETCTLKLLINKHLLCEAPDRKQFAALSLWHQPSDILQLPITASLHFHVQLLQDPFLNKIVTLLRYF